MRGLSRREGLNGAVTKMLGQTKPFLQLLFTLLLGFRLPFLPLVSTKRIPPYSVGDFQWGRELGYLSGATVPHSGCPKFINLDNPPPLEPPFWGISRQVSWRWNSPKFQVQIDSETLPLPLVCDQGWVIIITSWNPPESIKSKHQCKSFFKPTSIDLHSIRSFIKPSWFNLSTILHVLPPWPVPPLWRPWHHSPASRGHRALPASLGQKCGLAARWRGGGYYWLHHWKYLGVTWGKEASRRTNVCKTVWLVNLPTQDPPRTEAS